jgi:predicted DNA binding CopG/RHH family protein
MARRQNRQKLDKFEQRIEDSLEGYRPVAPTEKERILKAAGKTKTISMRLNETVLEEPRQTAAEDGLPFQGYQQ